MRERQVGHGQRSGPAQQIEQEEGDRERPSQHGDVDRGTPGRVRRADCHRCGSFHVRAFRSHDGAGAGATAGRAG